MEKVQTILAVEKERMREILLAAGYTPKDNNDFKPYVYDAHTKLLDTPPVDIQYLSILNDIVNNGTDLPNGKMRAVANRTIIIEPWDSPLLTLSKVKWDTAINELIGYLRGYTNIAQFKAIGVNTWDADANKPEWVSSEHRRGEGDLGVIYGAVAKDFHGIDLIDYVVSQLERRIDNRDLTITFWDPSKFELGCLKPCLRDHTFTILGDTLHLRSNQRSADWCLGVKFNLVQSWFLLHVMCHLFGYKPGRVTHDFINAHIYLNQLDSANILLQRKPNVKKATITFSPDFTSWQQLLTTHTATDIVQVTDYVPGKFVKVPLTVTK